MAEHGTVPEAQVGGVRPIGRGEALPRPKSWEREAL